MVTKRSNPCQDCCSYRRSAGLFGGQNINLWTGGSLVHAHQGHRPCYRLDPQPIWGMCRRQTVEVTLFLSLSPHLSLTSKNQWEGETKMAA